MNEAPSEARVFISSRAFATGALILLASVLGCRLLDDQHGWTMAVKLVSTTLAIAVVPGSLATLVWRPRADLTLLDVIGFGIGISFGVVQLLTMLAVAAHIGPSIILIVLMAASALLAARLVHRPFGGVLVLPDELMVLVLLAVLAVFLYHLGSPVDWYEDQVHVAIVRRLAALDAPRLDNVYFVPGIVYTYPFPGTHYFMALVARLGDVDALFTYHKLRLFWGPAALVMLHLAARAVFGGRAIATAVTVTAMALVCSGAFAMVPGFPSGWGQLTPYSHASDVAMTVVLPALLVFAFGYLTGSSRRERAFFLSAALLLVLMLAMVHIRELVQFAAYIGCFVLVTAAWRDLRPYLRRAVVLLLLTVVVGIAYHLWERQTVTLVESIVGDERTRLLQIARSSSLRTLLSAPAPTLLGDFLLNFEATFAGLTPLFLFAGPAVFMAFRHRPLVWFVCASTIVYLLIMSVPALAIPYIYLTYFEILYTPVRNVIFFTYLFAGAAVYLVVIVLARVDRTRISPLIVGAVAGALALLVSLCVNRSAGGFVMPAVAAYALAIMYVGLRAPTAGPRKWIVAAAVVAGLVALLPQRQPEQRLTHVSVRWTTGMPDEQRAALERQFSLSAGEPNSNYSDAINVWNYTLNDTSSANINALVTDHHVVDTNEIDSTRLSVAPQPPSVDHPYLGVQYAAWLQYPGRVLFATASLFLWVLGFIVPAALALPRGRALLESIAGATREPFYRGALSYALFMIPFAVWPARPTLSPVEATQDAAPTPAALVEQMPCVTTPRRVAPYSEDILGEALLLPEQEGCPPSTEVVTWIRRNIPVDAVFAINRWNPHLPTVFVPQQVVVYPQVEVSFEQEHELFRNYHQFYETSMRSHRVQPFFNVVETPEQRRAFVEALGVTHVLVDPAYHDELRPVLNGLPHQYAPRYDSGTWAVYEVIRQ